MRLLGIALVVSAVTGCASTVYVPAPVILAPAPALDPGREHTEGALPATRLMPYLDAGSSARAAVAPRKLQ